MEAKFSISEVTGVNTDVAKIRVIGVGGGGGNMINHIIREQIAERNGLKQSDLIVANTDAQALGVSLAKCQIQLGRKRTIGRGAGMKPQVGEEAAKESADEIREQLNGSNIVFIAAGLGGGTGTGAAPVVARVAKEIGALTVGVVTLPFRMEGKMRAKLATQGLQNLKEVCNSVIVIPNERLIGFIGSAIGYKESFKIVDDVLARAVSGMCSIVLKSCAEGINIDFADLETAMGFPGESLIGVGEASGEHAAQEAVKNSMQSPLLEGMSIQGAKGVLVHFTFHPDTPMSDINDAMSYVHEIVSGDNDDDVFVFWGTANDATLTDGKVLVTLVATGVGSEQPQKIVESSSKPSADKPAQKSGERENSFLSMFRRASGYDIREDDDLDVPPISRYRQD